MHISFYKFYSEQQKFILHFYFYNYLEQSVQNYAQKNFAHSIMNSKN